jgi:5-methylcytosine-specific restriction endonuclease McrA
MSELCSFGCGNIAVVQFKSSGKFCCSKSANSCFAQRQKNSLGNKDRKFSKESIEKMKQTKAEHPQKPWNKGLTKETDERVRRYGENVSKSLQANDKIRGENASNYIDGRSYKPNFCVDCGDQIEPRTERCMECKAIHQSKLMKNGAHKLDCSCPFCRTKRGECWGEENSQYIDGRTPLRNLIRNLDESSQWREEVFKRDNYICQECYRCGIKLNAHHIKEFNKILTEFLQEYSQFSPIEDKETLVRLALMYEPFWELSNGKTLCEECHDKTKGRKKLLEKE